MTLAAWGPGTGATGTGAHPLSVQINGRDYVRGPATPSSSPYVLVENLHVQMPGPGTNGSASFSIRDPGGDPYDSSDPYDSGDSYDSVDEAIVNELDEIQIIEHAAPLPTLFGGLVTSVRTEVRSGAAGRWLHVNCVGWGWLLDHKIVPSHPVPGAPDLSPATMVTSLVGNYGGRLQAQVFPIATTDYSDDPVAHVADPDDGASPGDRKWQFGVSVAVDDIDTPVTLGAALDSWLRTGEDFVISESNAIVPHVVWVDAYARVHATWAPPDGPNSAFEGEAPAIGESNTTDLSYQEDGSDVATSAYVAGANAAGTGYVRTSPVGAAGDLEELVTDSTSNTSDIKVARGQAALASLAASSVEGRATIASDVPLDYRPGMKVTITSSRIGIDAESFRIVGVEIDFQSLSQRTYKVAFGGRRGIAGAMTKLARISRLPL